MRAIDRVPSGWILSSIGLGLLVALIALRRWRHLFTFFVGLMVVALIGGEIIYEVFARPRPYDVTIIGRWAGFSMPAAPIAVATMFAIAIAYSLVPAGRARQTAKVVTIATVGVFAFAAMYLGTLHPSDIAVGVGISTAVLVNAFRFFTPNETFPVTYKRGKTAHLDVGGRRGEAIRRAVHDQLGLTVLDVRPIGLAGSGGSTPLLITVAGDPDTKLFGKLYAMSHVRADRWYKLGRMVLYGRLEDEAPYQLGAPARAVRGLRAAADAGPRHPHRGAVRDRRDDPRARVHARHRVLRGRRRDRRGRGRRQHHRPGAAARAPASGTPGWRTATSSPPTSSSATASSSSSTSPSPRCSRRRGGRRSTSPT